MLKKFSFVSIMIVLLGALSLQGKDTVKFSWAKADPNDTIVLESIPVAVFADVQMQRNLPKYKTEDKVVAQSNAAEVTIPSDEVRYFVMNSKRLWWPVEFVAVPGDDITISFDKDGLITIQGQNPLTNTIDSLRRQTVPFLNRYFKIKNSKEFQENPNDPQLLSQLSSLDGSINDVYDNYLKNNLNNPAAIWALRNSTLALDYIDKIGPEAINSGMKPIYTAIKADIDEYLAAQGAPNSLAQGETAPDFTLPDMEGNMVSLSSFRGKWVLLDLWGKWCIWCVRGFPQMKENYELYKDKCEFIGLDFFDDKEVWESTIKEMELPWLQLYVGQRDSEAASQIMGSYMVQGFPTKVLITPEGKVYKYLTGEDPSFYDDFSELFGK